jgi:hypothetical protein
MGYCEAEERRCQNSLAYRAMQNIEVAVAARLT